MRDAASGNLLTIRWFWACDFSCVAHPYTLLNLQCQSLNERMPGPKWEHVLMQKSTVAGRMGLLRDYLESWPPRSQCWWYTILGISSYSTQYKGRLHHQHEPPINHWFRPGKVTMCIPLFVFVVVHGWWTRRWFLPKIPEIACMGTIFSKKQIGGLVDIHIYINFHIFTFIFCRIDTIYYTMCSPTWYTSWWSLSAIQDGRINPSCPSSYWRNVLHHERLMILPQN